MGSRALIVIPAYNEAARLPALLGDVAGYLRSDLPGRASLCVQFALVDDGSREAEYEATRDLVERCQLTGNLRLVRLERNQGKGAAIRAGFALGLAEGHDYLGFIDGDGAVPVYEMHRALEYLAARRGTLSGVIGSRVQMLGRSVVRNPVRHYTGRVFATFVSVYFGHQVYDTQCGLKIFEREALVRHLDLPVDTRWVWDTQLLLAMLDANEPVHELPIDWRETGDSKVSMIRDPLTMIWRLARYRPRLRARTIHPRDAATGVPR